MDTTISTEEKPKSGTREYRQYYYQKNKEKIKRQNLERYYKIKGREPPKEREETNEETEKEKNSPVLKQLPVPLIPTTVQVHSLMPPIPTAPPMPKPPIPPSVPPIPTAPPLMTPIPTAPPLMPPKHLIPPLIPPLPKRKEIDNTTLEAFIQDQLKKNLILMKDWIEKNVLTGQSK